MAQTTIHVDTLFSVIEFLSIEDGLSVLSVCKSWHELDRFEIVWKTLLTNYIRFKIHIHTEQAKIKHKDFYNCLIYHLQEFYQTQVVTEKSVNKAKFATYMEDSLHEDGNQSTNEGKSSVFGKRFKQLASSAIAMHYNLIMSEGFKEINADFLFSIIDYEYPSFAAGNFLKEAQKFTQKGRVLDTAFSRIYWKRYSNYLLDLIINKLSRQQDYLNHFINFFNNFKPILNDKYIETIFSSCSICMYYNEDIKVDNLLKFVLDYISKEGNYEKSNSSFINLSNCRLSQTPVVKMKYLKKIHNMIYPNQFLTNIKKSFRDNRHILALIDGYNPKKVVDNICELLEIVEQTSVDISQLAPFCNNAEIVDLLNERQLITTNDYKFIFHTEYYDSTITHLLPKIGKDFDPYEIIQTRGWQPSNFVSTFFKSSNNSASIYKFFSPFFELYPEQFDLNILIEKGISNVRQTINYCIQSRFLQDTDIVKSLELMNTKFTPPLDVSCIESIVYNVDKYNNLTNRERQRILNGFLYLMQNIHHEGVPFEQYCKPIQDKYPTTDYRRFLYRNFSDEERMAHLYNLCLKIIRELEK